MVVGIAETIVLGDALVKNSFIVFLVCVLAGSAFAFGEGKYFKKGVKALNAGDLQTAKVFFNESINKNPKFSRGYSYLAMVQSKLGDTDDAIMNYRMAYKFDRKDYSSLTNLCGLYLDKGNLKGAHEACTKAISINPRSHAALNNRCQLFLMQKRYGSAIADCSQAISIKNDYVAARNNRGFAYLALQKYQRAAEDFTQAIKSNPTDATAYNNRCTAYKEMKDYEMALADCSKAIVMDGNLAEAYLNRGAIYELVGKKSDAVIDYAKYLRLRPEAETVRQKMKRLMKGEQ